MKILRYIDFIAPAQELSLTSEIGPTLGQLKIKAKPFCDKFNEKTKIYKKGLLMKVRITVYTNLTLDFEVKDYPVTFLLFYMAKNNKITVTDLYKIALIKKNNKNSLKSTYLNILNIAKNININISYES